MAESEEELKSLLMKVKEETEKAGLKLSIQKSKIMASGSITSWQMGKNSDRFYFLGLQNQLCCEPQIAQLVKNLPEMQKTLARSLGWENALEKGTDTHCSLLAWRIPCTEKPGKLQSMRSQRVRHDFHFTSF